MFLNKNPHIENIQLKKPFIPTLILLAVVVIGTIGYSILWKDTNSTLIDEIYMTFLTITTIGFAEIHPLDSIGRLFTIFIGIAGIGSLFYILSVIMENLVTMQMLNIRGKKKMTKIINNMSDHIILVGLGRVGLLAANELIMKNVEFVIIDEKIEETIEKQHLSKDVLYITGDASEDSVLHKAGIEKARGIIVTTGNSATTVFVVLSAKVLNPGIFVVARADDDTTAKKLHRAGADKVVNPYTIGGQRLANLMINPNIIDFFETSFGTGEYNLSIENIEMPADSKWCNKSLKDLDIRKKTGSTILAIIRNEKPNLNPDGNFELLPGDFLVAFGTREQLNSLEKLTLK